MNNPYQVDCVDFCYNNYYQCYKDHVYFDGWTGGSYCFIGYTEGSPLQYLTDPVSYDDVKNIPLLYVDKYGANNGRYIYKTFSEVLDYDARLKDWIMNEISNGRCQLNDLRGCVIPAPDQCKKYC